MSLLIWLEEAKQNRVQLMEERQNINVVTYINAQNNICP